MEIRIFWLSGLAAVGLAAVLSLSPSAQAEEPSPVAPLVAQSQSASAGESAAVAPPSGEVRVAPPPAAPSSGEVRVAQSAEVASSSGEVRVAQSGAPSGGDGRPVTLGDFRWMAERNDRRWEQNERRWAEMRAENERRWAEMRVEMNALRADLSNFKNLVITLLVGLLIAILGVPWGPRMSHWMGREKSDRSDPAWKSAP